jgi:hypothetical protein
MPIGSDVRVDLNYDKGTPTYPASFRGPFATVIDIGGLDDTADFSTPMRADNKPDTTSRHTLKLSNHEGTCLITRAVYDAAATTPAGGTFIVVGRYVNGSQASRWMLLRNKAGNVTRTPNYDVTNDASDGTYKVTTPSPTDDVWDTLGCNEFKFGTTAAHTVATGTATLGALEVGVV